MTIDTSKRRQNLPVGQYNLTGELVGKKTEMEDKKKLKADVSVDTIRIHGRSRLEKQFKGMAEVWMAVYVQNIEFIPKLIETHGLTKLPLVAKNHPMLEESKHHHI